MWHDVVHGFGTSTGWQLGKIAVAILLVKLVGKSGVVGMMRRFWER